MKQRLKEILGKALLTGLMIIAGTTYPAIHSHAQESLSFKDEIEISNFIKNNGNFYKGKSLNTLGNPWVYNETHNSVHLTDGVYSPTPTDTSPKSTGLTQDTFYNLSSFNVTQDYEWNIEKKLEEGEGQHLYSYEMKQGDIMPVSTWEYNALPYATHHVNYLPSIAKHVSGNWYDYCGVICQNDTIGNSSCDVTKGAWYFTTVYTKAADGSYQFSGTTYTPKYMRSATALSVYPIDYPAWRCKCAICGEYLTNVYFESPKDCLTDIKYIEIGTHVITKCRLCGALENEGLTTHSCEAISDNRYYIKYDIGTNDPNAYGNTNDTIFYANDSKQYEGDVVTNDKYLKYNRFTRPGYEFLGWSIVNDGTPDFNERADIYDLDMYKTEFINNNDTVTLYACWGAETATVQIDTETNNIWHNNTATVFGVTNYANTNTIHVGRSAGGDNKSLDNANQFSNNTLTISAANIVTPKGYIVSFNTTGTDNISPITEQTKVVGFTKEIISDNSKLLIGQNLPNTKGTYDSKGYLTSLTYTFMKAPCVEKLVLSYESQGITLPISNSEDSLFVGWYTTPDYTEGTFVGSTGDIYYPESNITLYARFADSNIEISDVYYSTETPITYDTTAKKDGNADNSFSTPDNMLAVNYGKGALNLRANLYTPSGVEIAYKTYYKPSTSDTWTVFDGNASADDNAVLSYEETFDYTSEGTKVDDNGNIIQSYTIPSTGFYELTVLGAQGQSYSEEYTGGLGGETKGKVYLKAGDVLNIVVGKVGDEATGNNLAGGGYSAVWVTNTSGETSLLTVAGGGGAASRGASGGNGGNADTNTLLTNETLIPQVGEKRAEEEYQAGGGGMQGGIAGEIVENIHHHSGSAGQSYANGCYTKAITTQERGAIGGYYGFSDGDGDGYCDQCHLTSGAHPKDSHPWYYTYSKTSYELGCGYTEGQVISYSCTASYGGSSYINPSFLSKAASEGKGTGNGVVTIKSVLTGLKDGADNHTELLGICTPDLANPSALFITKTEKDNITTLSWETPESNGTYYDIKFEEYEITADEEYEDGLRLIRTPDVVTKKLTSQVAGYYYFYNDTANFDLANYIQNTLGYTDTYTWLNKYCSENGLQFTKTNSLIITDTTHNYLHIAAVDVSGNIGITSTVETARTNVGSVIFDSNPFEYLLTDEVTVPWETIEKKYAISGTDVVNTGKGYDGINTHLSFGEDFPTIEIEGCTFLGWNDNPNWEKLGDKGTWYSKNGTGSGLAPDQSKTLVISDITGKNTPGQTITLYAIWEEKVNNTTTITGTKNIISVNDSGVHVTPSNITLNTSDTWVTGATAKVVATAVTGPYMIDTEVSKYNDISKLYSTLHYYTAGNTPAEISIKDLLDANKVATEDTKLNTGTSDISNNTLYHKEFTLNESLNVQGSLGVTTEVISRENNTAESTVKKVFIDNTPVQIKSYDIAKESLKDLTEQQVEDKAAVDGLTINTTFTVHASDYAKAENGNYTSEDDTSGIKGVYITLYTTKEDGTITKSVTKEMALKEEISKTLTGSTLDGIYELSVDLYKEFADSQYVYYRVEAIDNAGNVGSSIFVTNTNDPSFTGEDQFDGVLDTFDVVTYIYNTTSDEYTLEDGVSTYFAPGDEARVVTYTVGYAEKISFAFEDIGYTCADYIEKGKYDIKNNMGVPLAGYTREYTYNSTSDEVTITKIASPDHPDITTDIGTIPYANKYEYTVRIFPYVNFNKKDTKTELYTVTAFKTRDGVDINALTERKYYLYSEGSDLHYRSY